MNSFQLLVIKVTTHSSTAVNELKVKHSFDAPKNSSRERLKRPPTEGTTSEGSGPICGNWTIISYNPSYDNLEFKATKWDGRL